MNKLKLNLKSRTKDKMTLLSLPKTLQEGKELLKYEFR